MTSHDMCTICKCELNEFEIEAITEIKGSNKNKLQYSICDDCVNCLMADYGYYNDSVNFHLGDKITITKREACCRFGM